MSWRTAPLPKDWHQRRAQRLALDATDAHIEGQCTAVRSDGTRCPAGATDVHHIGDASDHRIEQLRSACAWHHKRATSEQANAARVRRTTRHPSEKHPGLA